MAFSISFYPEADLELAEAIGWYEEQQRGLGFEFYEDYLAVRNRLLETPAVFPIVFGNVRRAVFRKFPYSVFFLIEGNTIVVYAVFHQKRNPKSWLGRLK